MQRAANRRKNKERNRIQHENCSQRNRNILVARICNRSNRRNRAASANRSSYGNQIRNFPANAKHPSKQSSQRHRRRNSNRRIDKSRTPRVNDFMQIHSKSQANNGRLQQPSRKFSGMNVIRVSKRKSVNQSAQQRNRRRNISTSGKN